MVRFKREVLGQWGFKLRAAIYSMKCSRPPMPWVLSWSSVNRSTIPRYNVERRLWQKYIFSSFNLSNKIRPSHAVFFTTVPKKSKLTKRLKLKAYLIKAILTPNGQEASKNLKKIRNLIICDNCRNVHHWKKRLPKIQGFARKVFLKVAFIWKQQMID